MSTQLLSFFFADGEVKTDADEPTLLWKAVLRTGSWKLRPGPGGVKLKAPLHVYRDKAPKGHISMTALKEAFDAKAKEMVTIPQVHADGTTSDGGFVHKLAIEDRTDESGKVVESVLWSGMEITDSDLKKKLDEKSIRGCSGGILFDYERTEDGKKFPQILSHVMVTNSPWINGTGDYTDKLPEGVMASESNDLLIGELELSSDEDEFDDSFKAKLRRFLGVEAPAETPDPKLEVEDPEKVELAGDPAGTVVWKPSEGFQVVRSKVQNALNEYSKAVSTEKDEKYFYCEDISGNGRSLKALVCKGYGDTRDAWIVPVKLKADNAELEEFENWTPAKQEWVAASEQSYHSKPPAPVKTAERPKLTALQEAQAARAEHLGLGEFNTPNQGGSMGIMDILKASGVELSEETLEAARQEEERFKRFEEQAAVSARASREAQADTYLSEFATKLGLEAPEGEKDAAKSLDPALARYVRGVLMSDDGGPALELSLSTEGGPTKPVAKTASEIMKGLIDVLPTDKDGKIALGLAQQARRLPNEDPAPPAKTDDKDEKTPQQKADAFLAELDPAQTAALGIPMSANGKAA